MQELAPVATLVVATVALYVGLRTIRQRDLADAREQWWTRFRWASDLTSSDDPESRELGLSVLVLLGTSRLAGPEELDLLDARTTVELQRRPELLDDGWEDGDDGYDDTDAGGSGRG